MPLPNYYRYGDLKEYEDVFLQGKEVKKVKKSEILKSYSDNVEHYYYLKRGLIKVKACHIDGYEKIMHITGAGCMEPVFSFEDIPIWRENFQYEAYMDIEVTAFTKQEVIQRLEKYPGLLRKMYNNAVKSLYSSDFNTMRILYDEGFRRMCDFLYYHLHDHKVIHNHERCQMVITQNDMASMIGIDRVNANRMLQQLRNEGIIEMQRKHIVIRDKDKLALYCSNDVTIAE